MVRIEDRDEVNEFLFTSESLGEAVLKIITSYLQTPLANIEQLRSYSLTKVSLGRVTIRPQLPGNTVTWLNSRLKEKRTHGKFTQSENSTTFDPLKESGVEVKKKQPGRVRKRH